jgi:hypothetical protein
MIITKKALSRRTVLRGLGAAVALPLLDGMVPAFAAVQNSAARPVPRLGVVYIPNGMYMQNWTPETEGTGFEFSPILKPLEPFREQLLVMSGLNSTPPRDNAGVNSGLHARASTRFLTHVMPRRTLDSSIEAGVSMDQHAARLLGEKTQLASLELALEARDFAGACDVGFSCTYTNTISWRGDSTPLPMEHNPRAVFERLFGDEGNTDPAVRLARIQEDRSVLDSVTARAAELRRQIGTRDQVKLGEYMDAVRDVERRLQLAEAQSDRDLPIVDQPVGVPDTFEAHAKLMFDLQVLAYQSDLTRIITFMMGRELSGRAFPEIGAPGGHHPTSHHQGDPKNLEQLTRIKAFHAELFGYYLDKLRATEDGDGTLLDNVMLIFGAGMSDSNQHAPNDLPIVVAGGGAGQIKGGRHVQYPAGTPLANMNLSLLDMLGVPTIESIGDSTGRIEHLDI